MFARLCLVIATIVAASLTLLAQKSSAVLFTVDGQPVTVEEFDYIYRKTNADSADYSKASLDEYLDLYRRFKLKVAKARELGLDTVPALNQELAGYRRQLSDSYLVDLEVTEPMVKELYERRKTDVNVLHVAVNLPPFGQDTLMAYKKIQQARERVTSGEMWGKVAKDLSEDPSATRNAGEVGFVTAPLPEGLYALENAVYGLKPGDISDIIRSEKAYHVIRVMDRRPARGEVEAAHIFIRKPSDTDLIQTDAKARIDSIYKALQAGADFGELATELSDDTRSAPRQGYIGFFGIGRYEPAFEDAAFSMDKDGDHSKPVETRVGWHILRRISRREQGDYASTRQELVARVKRMPRFQEGRREMVKRLQKKYSFQANEAVLTSYVASLPDSFLSYKWRPAPVDDAALFSFEKSDKVMLSDFTDYLRQNTSQRVKMENQYSVPQASKILYEDFVVDQTLLYAESRLDKDNPAFYNLMREYEEGILLFEATKINVWDKAGRDTIGLEAFFREHANNYRWAQRVVLDVYTIPLDKQDELFDPLVKFARKNSSAEVLAKFNSDDASPLTHHERIVEKGKEPSIDAIAWKRGEVMAPERDTRKQVLRVGVVREVLPAAPKKLSEARGYVIADYQDELEKRWVAELATEFPVRIDGAVLESMVK